MEVNWSQVLGDVVTQVLRVLIPFLVAVIAKWAVELWQTIKAEQPNIVPILEYFVEMGVYAAEQIYGSGHGETKKEYALEVVQKWLEEAGLPVDVKLISDAIEAEVYRQFHRDETPALPEATEE